MALNPLISLSAQAPQIDLAGDITKANQAQLTGQQVQSGQNALDQTAAINDAYKQAGGDRNKLIGLIAQAGYGSAIPALTKTYAEADKATAGALTDAQKVQLGHVQMVGQLLNGVTDDASYQQALGAAHANGINIAGAPTSYDPSWVAQTKAHAQTVNDYVDQQNKDRQFNYTVGNDAANRGVTMRGQDMTFRSEANGQQIRAQDYDPKSGVVVNKLTGQATTVLGPDGQPVTRPSQNLTETQGNAVAFGARAQDAQNTLRQLEASGVTNGGAIKSLAGSVPIIGGGLSTLVNVAPTALGGPSSEQQTYEQARRNFISAVLRKESGAAISDSEYANETKKYFPEPGDSQSVIESKARSRDLAIEALKAQAGPGATMIPGVISGADQAYQSQPRPSQQQAAPARSSVPSSPSNQRASVPAGTVKTIGGSSYQFDGHGWLRVQ